MTNINTDNDSTNVNFSEKLPIHSSSVALAEKRPNSISRSGNSSPVHPDEGSITSRAFSPKREPYTPSGGTYV